MEEMDKSMANRLGKRVAYLLHGSQQIGCSPTFRIPPTPSLMVRAYSISKSEHCSRTSGSMKEKDKSMAHRLGKRVAYLLHGSQEIGC